MMASPMSASPAEITAAAAQLPAFPLAEAARSLQQIEAAFAEAAKRAVDLLVLPECAYPAYLLGSPEHYAESGCLTSDQFLSRLGKLVAEAGLHAVCGFVERRDEKLHNAAALLGPDGATLGVHRKSFLWGDDLKCFSPGESIDVFDSDLGPIGIAICADLRSPEIMASLVDQGARLVAVPTCWVNVATESGRYSNPQPEFLIEARGREFGVPLVCANKFGMESPDLGYCGMSMIVAGDGETLAQAEPDREAMLVSSVKLGGAPGREVPHWAAVRILTPEDPIEPAADAQRSITVAAIPDVLVEADRGRLTDSDVLERLAVQNVDVVIARMTPGTRSAAFELHLRAMGMTAITAASDCRVMYEPFGSFGCVEAEEVMSFAPLRALALDGAALLVGLSVPGEPTILRARAMENRCWLAATQERSATIVAPNGAITACGSATDPEPVVATLDLNDAANKLVFTNTHIWDQRRPEVYAAATHLGLDV